MGGGDCTYLSPGLGTEHSSCSRPPHRDSSTLCKSLAGPGGVGGTPGPGPPPASRRPGPHLEGEQGLPGRLPKNQGSHCNPPLRCPPPARLGLKRGGIRTQAVALIGHASALGGVQHQGSSAGTVIGADGVDAVPPHAGLGFFVQTLVIIWGNRASVTLGPQAPQKQGGSSAHRCTPGAASRSSSHWGSSRSS
uniref:Uncharacterized protein n=1 Tax=Micrurus spixii TaxID=129469 RepID=A0A2D4MHU0_9SAUR